jgi:antimicrobial peptide system SdpA family protein
VRAVTEDRAKVSDFRLGRTAAGIGAMWALVIGYVLLGQLPPTALSLPFVDSVRQPIRVLATQGWAFFTKSPREAHVVAMGPQGSEWRSVMLAPHSEPRNAFGFNRASRAQGVEMGILIGALRPSNWVDCGGQTVAECVRKAVAVGASVTNPMPAPTLCGAVALVKSEPTPWAWASQEADAMPLSMSYIEVSCP